MNDLVHIETEVRNLGLKYQNMAGMAFWGKIGEIRPKVAYNSPIYVLVVRYDKFWPYLCLHYQFWPFSILSGMFDHIAIKMPSCSNEVCLFIATFDAAQLIRVNFEELSLNWLRMSFDAKEWQTLHNTACNGPVWPHLVKMKK